MATDNAITDVFPSIECLLRVEHLKTMNDPPGRAAVSRSPPELEPNKGFQRPVCCHYTMGVVGFRPTSVHLYHTVGIYRKATPCRVSHRVLSTNKHARDRANKKPLTVVLGVGVEQFGDRAVLEYGADGAGQQRGDRDRRSSHPSAFPRESARCRSARPHARRSSWSRSMAGPETMRNGDHGHRLGSRVLARGMRPRWYRRCRSGHRQARSPLPATSPTTRLATTWFGRVMSRVLCTKASGPPPRRCAHCSATRMRPASGTTATLSNGPGNDHGRSRPALAWPPR